MTQAFELASGEMAMKVALLSTPSTEIWNETVQPVGILAGNWKLIWSSPAYPARPAKSAGIVTPPTIAFTFEPLVVKSKTGDAALSPPFIGPRPVPYATMYWPGLAG